MILEYKFSVKLSDINGLKYIINTFTCRLWAPDQALKLNQDKTQAVLIAIPATLCKTFVVMLDSVLCFDARAKNITETAFFTWRTFSDYAPFPHSVAMTLAPAFITSRLNYYTAHLHGLPTQGLKKHHSMSRTQLQESYHTNPSTPAPASSSIPHHVQDSSSGL